MVLGEVCAVIFCCRLPNVQSFRLFCSWKLCVWVLFVVFFVVLEVKIFVA